jgi:hypothetical protein
VEIFRHYKRLPFGTYFPVIVIFQKKECQPLCCDVTAYKQFSMFCYFLMVINTKDLVSTNWIGSNQTWHISCVQWRHNIVADIPFKEVTG